MLEHTGLNKLDGFSPIYVINMERSVDRKTYIENHFKKYGVLEYNFVNGIDGSKEDLNTLLFSPIYNCIYPYYYMIIVLFVLILLLLILILFILIFKK